MPKPGRSIVVTVLGLGQILAWGSSYYLLAVLAQPIAQDTGWPFAWVVGGLSLGLLAAGLISPRVGRAIERRNGRDVLALSAVLLAIGLASLAASPSLPAYLAAWFVIGLGMGTGLYDASFATLGRLYGQEARQAITALTLFGGLASTACWPFSAFLVSALGWRGTCLAYAGLHLGLVLPLYLLAVPRAGARNESAEDPHSRATVGGRRQPADPRATLLFILLAAVITIASAISTVVSVHLLAILQDRGLALAAAVALGALVGPSQVGARVIEMLIGRHHHPIWTLVASTVLMAGGIGALWAGSTIVAAALVVYGAGVGIESIARGTLPLVLFGASGYAVIMGRLAMPSLIAQAASPLLGAILMARAGASATLAVLCAVALVNVMVMLTLARLSWSAQASERRREGPA